MDPPYLSIGIVFHFQELLSAPTIIIKGHIYLLCVIVSTLTFSALILASDNSPHAFILLSLGKFFSFPFFPICFFQLWCSCVRVIVVRFRSFVFSNEIIPLLSPFPKIRANFHWNLGVSNLGSDSDRREILFYQTTILEFDINCYACN